VPTGRKEEKESYLTLTVLLPLEVPHLTLLLSNASLFLGCSEVGRGEKARGAKWEKVGHSVSYLLLIS
jgi:hypothetical protein